ncbi:hypothetical protein GF380_04375 [Candidatus Uhrbacteria bacterium]|nr:hypothetical protein [Candidatus Uhrbacteria bacterium]
MAAGDHDYVFGWVYDSDDDVPIAAGDNIYRDGPILGDFFAGTMRLNYRYQQYWLANNANPAGITFKGYEISAVSYTHFCIDAVGFYCALGKVTADTPASDQFKIQGSVDGDVPSRIFHVEDNHLDANQAEEFEDVKVVEADIVIHKGALALTQRCNAENFSDMTNDSVVRQTGYDPEQYRGTNAPTSIPECLYRIANSSMTLTWDSKSLGKYIKVEDQTICGWMNPLELVHLDDGNPYPSIWLREKREFKPITFTFIVPPGDIGDLDNMRAYAEEDTMSSKTQSDLVWKIPRRHSNDYIQITFKSVYLIGWNMTPAPDSVDSIEITGTWSPPLDIEVIDRQVTSAGVADPNEDADYEV